MAAGAARATLLALLAVACFIAAAATAVPPPEEEALVGLDFGSEWIEIAIARGTDIDIVLNENTQRKSLAALAFPEAKDGADAVRLFGEAAMARPHAALQYVRELLGESAARPPRSFAAEAAVAAAADRSALSIRRLVR